MRVLILTQYFPPEIGAPQVRLGAMVRELVRLGHEVEVVTGLPNYPTGRTFPEYRRRLFAHERWEGAMVTRVWMYPAIGGGIRRMVNYLSFTLMSLAGLARASRPSVIFVESPPLTTSLPAVLFARLWRCPIIFNVADLWPDSVREMGLMREGPVLRCAEWLEEWSYANATFVNAVTEGIRRTLLEAKHLPAEKILFLPNGVDSELFRPRAPDQELARELNPMGKRLLVYAGTLGFAQGLDVLIDAMRLIEHDEPSVQLVFLGSGSDRERLEERVRERRLSNVRFLDPKPVAFVSRLYSISYAGVASLRALPVLEGARPSKLFPIMSSGKPVLYSGNGEAARLIMDAEAGLVAPAEDPRSLADNVRALVRDPELARTLGDNGRRFVEKNLTWSSLIGAWVEQFMEKSAVDAGTRPSSRQHVVV